MKNKNKLVGITLTFDNDKTMVLTDDMANRWWKNYNIVLDFSARNGCTCFEENPVFWTIREKSINYEDTN